MTRYLSVRNTAAATVVVFAMVAAVTVVGAGALVVGTQEAAAAHDSDANYTVTLPNEDDHLPGDQNPEGASIEHDAAGGEAFTDIAPDGFETFDRLELQSDHVDFSACSSENTAVFGVDRGDNNTGTQTDDSLLEHMKSSTFREDSLEVVFYDEGDLGGNPTHLEPEDAIVALQGAGSSGGPCFTMPTEPGWYQISGTLEGTNHEGESVTIAAESHYFPICEGCHDEATAEEKLGPAPSRDGSGSDPTPTATETPAKTTATEEPETTATTATDAPEPTDGGQSTPTATESSTDGTSAATETADGSAGGEAGDRQGTPTPGDGPGFTGLAALLALLASALLVRRR